MSGRVEGKVAVITGAAQGIGRACAELLAREGAWVVIGDIRTDQGAATVEAIRAEGGEALFRQTDIIYEEQCAALIHSAVENFGRLDVLVNNAGWFPRATLEQTTTELWDRVIAVNLRGAFYCCKYAVPQMRAGGGGSIVNMGSVNAVQGIPTLFAYAAAKGGLLTLTRTLAGAHAREGIRVNYVMPGWVLTDTEREVQRRIGVGEDELRRAGEALPLGRHQTPEDIAYAVLYLASDESSQITGITLPVDAGVSSLPIQPDSPYID
jgi:NAD(P)-dependent dehydrogenase (short-subunit alcohol dehydrogenase family)